MKVQKSELLSVLAMIRPGLAKKEIVEQATHFIFSGTDVATFNDQVCVLHPFKSDISFSVKGEDFYKILGGITENEIELTLEDDNLKITTKKTKAKLSTVVDEAAMVSHLVESVRQCMIGKDFWKPLPKDFTDGIYLCAFSASKDITTGIRSCCAIKGDGIYTTDGIRCSMYIMESSMDTILLPAKDAQQLVNYKVVEYGFSDNWAHFRTADGVIFNCKTMKGDYPYTTIENLFTEDEPILSFPNDLRENIDAIKILSEGEGEADKSITVTVAKGRITAKAEQERGYIEKTVESDYAGETFVILINPIFFSQVLKHAVSFALVENRGMFSGENFYHVLALPEAD